jgi:hypothetical protein
VLTGSVATQRFKPVSGWYLQLVQPPCAVEKTQLHERRQLDIGRQTA